MLRKAQLTEFQKYKLYYCCLFLIWSSVLLISCENVLADAIGINTPPITGLAIGTWSGSGTVVDASNTFCIGSVDGTSFSYTVASYHVRVSNNTTGSSGQFRLLNGTQSLPVTLVYKDLFNSGTETLIEGTLTSTGKNGSTTCNSDNGQIDVSIAETALLAVPAGLYKETMKIDFLQISPATATSLNNYFDISLTVPDLVRISNLNDINLGSWSGMGNLANSDAICVYKNSLGTYSITFSGDGGKSHVGTAFLLTNNSKDLAYTVTYNDGTGAVTALPGVKLTGRTGHNQSSTTCGGSTNATISVTILESIMASAPADSYHGTLTMLVSPQ